MRKFLLASVATLGTGGLIGTAVAQQTTVVGAPSQGQVAFPAANPTAYVNNNNNYQAPALPGALANPTPGTIVIHINGKVQAGFLGTWTSADARTFTAPAGSPGGAPISPGTVTVPASVVGAPGVNSGATSLATVLGQNGAGTVKLQPQSMLAFMRLYFGADGMATNGLRYGAAIELRQNFSGELSNETASAYDSRNTVFVRRAFTYAAGENWGLVRVGIGDGVIGIFDNGVTTTQWGAAGEFNGGDVQTMPGNVAPPWWFLSQAGAEYDNAKVVYLSPQIAGFDFGFQYAPTTSNGYANGNSGGGIFSSLTGAGIGTGITCGTATTGCATTSSGPGALDGARILNQTAIGLRYQGQFSGVGILAYGAYEFSGHANYSGAASNTVGGAANLGINAASFTAGATGTTASFAGTQLATPAALAAGSRYTGNYDGLSFGSGGLAVTYAGFTLAGNVIGGRLNNQMNLAPKNGAGLLAYTIGLKYVNGPWTFGVAGEIGWYQGTVAMTGLSQRRGRGFVAGGQYTVAPGYIVYGEYLWNDQQQTGVNLITGGTGSTANNNIKGQGFVIGNVVNF